MWHDSFTSGTWLIHKWDMTHSYVGHDSFICRTILQKLHFNSTCVCTPLFGRCIHVATHCNTLQHTAAHCSTLQHTATHCNTLQHKPASDGPGNNSLLLHLTCDSKLLDIHIYIWMHFLMYFSQHLMYSQSHVGWHFRMLFQSSKLAARRSLFTETWQKRRWSFELWALN